MQELTPKRQGLKDKQGLNNKRLNNQRQIMSDQKPSLNRKHEPLKPKGPLPPPPKAGTNMWRNKNFLLIIFILIMIIFLARMVSENQPSSRISMTEFTQMMSDPAIEIKSLELQKVHDGIKISGTRKKLPDEKEEENAEVPALLKSAQQKNKDVVVFTSHMLHVGNDLIHQWETTKDIKINVKHEEPGWLGSLITFLPIIILLVFFWMMMMRQGGGAGGGRGIFSFGKSKARLLDSSKPGTTFKDVAGAEEAKVDLEELVQFLKNPKKFDQLGGRIPKGALLVGPPGTGKTLLARAVAGEAGVPFFSMSGSDFVEMFVGVGASRVRDLFETGKKHSPCIIFIDEIDAVGRQRGAGLGGGHDEREQTLNQLLVEMDGFAPNEGVILLAATNRPDVLDKALLRPGRFDRQVVVNLPDMQGREAILAVHVKKRKVPVADDVDLKTVAKGTPGLAGADLENLVNEAALLAARFGQDKVGMIDFEEARDKLWMGAERKTLLMSEHERKLTAYHEAGHALVNLMVDHADPLHKITIIPRGRALGLTMALPEGDRVTMGRDNIEDQIAILMGGRLAEKLIFDHMSTGASNDIERASDLARKMVTVWGFTDELGPVSYGKSNEEIFLGREISQHRDFSEHTAQKIDDAVRNIIEEQVTRVTQILMENRDKLEALGDALLEHEVLDREEIEKVLKGETLESTKKSRQYLKVISRDSLRNRKDTADEKVESSAGSADDTADNKKHENTTGEASSDDDSQEPPPDPGKGGGYDTRA